MLLLSNMSMKGLMLLIGAVLPLGALRTHSRGTYYSFFHFFHFLIFTPFRWNLCASWIIRVLIAGLSWECWWGFFVTLDFISCSKVREIIVIKILIGIIVKRHNDRYERLYWGNQQLALGSSTTGTNFQYPPWTGNVIWGWWYKINSPLGNDII